MLRRIIRTKIFKGDFDVFIHAQRFIRVYERAGFTPLNTFLQRTNGGTYEFLRMVRTI
jgi:RimJ/RimL family protein N-acetyltransferase